jgi:hypothetical protein
LEECILNFREIIDMDKYEQIVKQFTDELEKVGITPLNQDVLVTLPVQSFNAFF